ncbi:hypothetical protein [Streptomyces alboniger]|uniref:hypothetical protein n=1 Tax=Streptomyces alboniger TaxID=132473 RepID=UPI0006E1E2B4
MSSTLGSAPGPAVTVKSYPVVAGAGIPVFGGEFDPTAFHVSRRGSFPNDVTITWFTRGRS